MQDLPADLVFEIYPKVVRALYERHVSGALSVGVTDDARLAAMRTERMDVLELLEDKGFEPALAKFPGSGGTHRSAADHDYIVVGHEPLAEFL
jgi:hypothetical protein